MVGTNAVLNPTTAITRSAVAVIATVFRETGLEAVSKFSDPPEAYCDCHGKYQQRCNYNPHIVYEISRNSSS